MTERIAQAGLPSPRKYLHRRFQPGTGGNSFFNGRVEVKNDEVQMHRCPVPSIVARKRASWNRNAASIFLQ